jgi:hypothetical protein
VEWSSIGMTCPSPSSSRTVGMSWRWCGKLEREALDRAGRDPGQVDHEARRGLRAVVDMDECHRPLEVLLLAAEGAETDGERDGSRAALPATRGTQGGRARRRESGSIRSRSSTSRFTASSARTWGPSGAVTLRCRSCGGAGLLHQKRRRSTTSCTS